MNQTDAANVIVFLRNQVTGSNPDDPGRAVVERVCAHLDQQIDRMNEPSSDGNPAFPFEHMNCERGKGMTLRDYFAGQALAGGLEQGVENNMASSMRESDYSWWHEPSKVARRAYAIADAMLKERQS